VWGPDVEERRKVSRTELINPIKGYFLDRGRKILHVGKTAVSVESDQRKRTRDSLEQRKSAIPTTGVEP